MIWTVFFTTACMKTDGTTTRGIGAEEFFGPHDIVEARRKAATYGSNILAMIPGSHINKTFLFDREYENGREPIKYNAVCGVISAG